MLFFKILMNEINAPTLENLIYEHSVLSGGLKLATKRLDGGEKLQDYIYKTLVVVTRAYLMVAKKEFPTELEKERYCLREQLTEFRNKYDLFISCSRE